MLQTRFLPTELTYDGTQLATHWPRRTAGVTGDCVVAFLGPAEVPTENLVDLEDRRTGERITAKRMLHLVGVWFGRTLAETVLRQRLYVFLAAERLRLRGVGVVVEGDDLYTPDRRKLSVSIATKSPLAGLVHLGLNDDPTGAPVLAVGLAELGVGAADFARELLDVFEEAERDLAFAAAKVRAVE
ncbi:MAG: hypothetical protein A2Y64_01125 [Candidatus Coatesbacteria bacterium RBG_13_66_14]|uniref:DUF366 domain-containing protein n=1 Tax=Candidatus Coatesbacteria bacterium RBG_13_66_14 TaxID=1817816 RepID=A0A1F5FJ77_9BACT|nr:MAG: hypothetical protein A2Y64_01125 [Candidatus Coatesbacteria bacterium RBG_13_66_14]